MKIPYNNFILIGTDQENIKAMNKGISEGIWTKEMFIGVKNDTEASILADNKRNIGEESKILRSNRYLDCHKDCYSHLKFF